MAILPNHYYKLYLQQTKQMKTENILLTIFIITYIVTFLLFLKASYKMHKNNDSDDPFYGSHIVVVLCFIGLFIATINFLERLKERD